MRTSVYHIQINVSNAKISIPFYKKLLSYFEYQKIDANGTRFLDAQSVSRDTLT